MNVCAHPKPHASWGPIPDHRGTIKRGDKWYCSCHDPVPLAQRAAERERIERLIGAAPEMLAMLKELEWAGTLGDWEFEGDCCPVCSAPVETRHDSDCKLAALIKKTEGETP